MFKSLGFYVGAWGQWPVTYRSRIFFNEGEKAFNPTSSSSSFF